MKSIDDNTIDACITDPPYGMGMEHWDHSVPEVPIWKEVFRILKPGAFCLSFGSPELYHRLAVNVEDAGFNIKDQIMWMTTTKMVKKNRLKPAHEPIVVAQKPYKGSLKSNFEKWGCGIINTTDTRIPWDKEPPKGWVASSHSRRTFGKEGNTTGGRDVYGTYDANPDGRYPSNIIGEVLPEHQKYFYAPRVTRKERGEDNDHPTPKPISLMSYLIRIYAPDNGIVIDPFCGSGSTGVAALQVNRRFIGIEMEEKYIKITKRRMSKE
jgi:site-specific DNA-methyltransferase (adenine-specific)